MIFKQKKQNTFETQDEWFDRLTLNIGKAVCLLVIIMSIVGAVAHIASAMWVNFALDFAILAIFSVILAHTGEEERL